MSEKSPLRARRGEAAGWLVLVVVWGCAGVSTHRNARQPTVDLTVRAAVEGASPVEPRVASISADGVVVTGIMSAPNPCYELRASLESAGEALTLRLSAVSTGGFCIQTLAAFAYDARISGMKAGSYPVDVVYTYPNTGWEDRAFRLRVTVP